jgi:methionine-rich copper-binding protein CopC
MATRQGRDVMGRLKAAALTVATLGALNGVRLAPAHAEVLITEQEAMRPPAAPKAEEASRGIFRAPKIEVLSPPEAGTVTSPLNLKLKFESFGGTKIDEDSVRVIYLKNPSVDLTPRLKKHLKSNGIEMDVAEAPPGEHHLKVEVKDSDGHLGTADVVFKVTK